MLDSLNRVANYCGKDRQHILRSGLQISHRTYSLLILPGLLALISSLRSNFFPNR
jgi:hypothetical protein